MTMVAVSLPVPAIYAAGGGSSSSASTTKAVAVMVLALRSSQGLPVTKRYGPLADTRNARFAVGVIAQLFQDTNI